LWCGVIQIVDQVNHHYNQLPEWHHHETMALVDDLTRQIAEHFDEVILLSDHGMPVSNPTEYPEMKIRVHAHEPYCFLSSSMDLDIKGTLQVQDAILKVVKDG